jgi:hypothetical protein
LQADFQGREVLVDVGGDLFRQKKLLAVELGGDHQFDLVFGPPAHEGDRRRQNDEQHHGGGQEFSGHDPPSGLDPASLQLRGIPHGCNPSPRRARCVGGHPGVALSLAKPAPPG